MPVYHFSEEPDIAVFEPRTMPGQDEALVWAIGEWHAPMYYVPRDCPRACFWPDDSTTAADRERWFAGVDARMVIVVESGWLERIRSTTLYRYSLPEESFTLLRPEAGHWVSRETVHPLEVQPIPDLLAALTTANIELRVTPRLLDLWSQVIESSLAFSGTRLRNALN